MRLDNHAGLSLLMYLTSPSKTQIYKQLLQQFHKFAFIRSSIFYSSLQPHTFYSYRVDSFNQTSLLLNEMTEQNRVFSLKVTQRISQRFVTRHTLSFHSDSDSHEIEGESFTLSHALYSFYIYIELHDLDYSAVNEVRILAEQKWSVKNVFCFIFVAFQTIEIDICTVYIVQHDEFCFCFG